MFTSEQIKTAHAKVKSGADFPVYLQDLIKLGVTHYEVFVSDGHTDFYGKNNFKVTHKSKLLPLKVATNADIAQFKLDLKAHQNGKTDYFTFCNEAAKSGVEKWKVIMKDMTCTYFDKAGNEILAENIPG